jgi:hypothetical protein
MGYYADLIDGSFHLKQANRSDACDALLAANQAHQWFDPTRVGYDLEAMLSHCGYEAEVAREDNKFTWGDMTITQGRDDIIDLAFRGQKYRHDELIFAALAPYVETGSFFVFRGEDGDMWRFNFHDGRLFVANARITFGEEEEVTVAQDLTTSQ